MQKCWLGMKLDRGRIWCVCLDEWRCGMKAWERSFFRSYSHLYLAWLERVNIKLSHIDRPDPQASTKFNSQHKTPKKETSRGGTTLKPQVKQDFNSHYLIGAKSKRVIRLSLNLYQQVSRRLPEPSSIPLSPCPRVSYRPFGLHLHVVSLADVDKTLI